MNDPTKYSNFLAPLDFYFSVGMDYKPKFENGNTLSVALLPLSYKFRYINDDVSVHTLDGLQKNIVNDSYPVEECRPFLRPMSSMTETEREELAKCVNLDTSVYGQARYLDWLNRYHFDYRNLIGRGLANAAPEGMYKN